MVYVCLVKGCINSFKYTTKKCKLFKFPKDEFMSKQWLINCNRQNLIGKSLEYFKVCSDHFLECMYKTAEKKVLLPHAVPTDFTMIPKEDSCTTTACQDTSISNPIFNASVSTSTPLNQEESFSYSCLPSQSTSCSTDQSMSSSTQTTQLLTLHTPRKQKYRAQLQNIKNKYEQLEQKFEALSQEVHKKSCANEIDVTSVELFNRVVEAQLPPNLSMVIKQYVQMGKRKPQGVRYSNEIKQLALTIFFFGPQVYTFLKTLLLLPSPRTLRRITQKINIVPGLNDVIFETIELKINNLKDDAKDCVLCIDEMSIKTHLFYNLSHDYIVGFNNSYDRKTYEPAKHVLCFMLRSINYNWKQPIAYFFINNSCTGLHLQNTIFAVISRIQKTSLNIRVLTTDQGSNFTSFAKAMNVSCERPFFFVNGRKIFYVFDVPHLLKSTRNNFFKYQLTFLNSTTSKKHLVDFFKSDQGLNRLAPKLTEMHINPGPFQKMKVKLASQIFSNTVAAGMKCCVQGGTLPSTANATITFIEHMDKLFDLLNSKKKVSGSKDFNRPFKNTASQREHLLHMLDVFKNMKVLDPKIVDGQILINDVTKRMHFLDGWTITISSLLKLWDDISKIPDLAPDFVLCTYRFNQDCLENLFGQFRNQSGNNVNPTPIQFLWTFKKIFFLNYFKHSKGSNCLDDMAEVLTTIGYISPPLSKSCVLFPEKTPFDFSNLQVGTTDYRELYFPAQNALTYVCGYLIKKCLEKHGCDLCVHYAQHQQQLDQSFLFIHFKAYVTADHSNFGKLNVPPNEFFNYINQLDDVFIVNFPVLAVESNVGSKLKNLFDNIPFDHPCKHFDIEFLKKLYIRLRIYHSINKLNKDMLTTGRKHRKLDILSHL